MHLLSRPTRPSPTADEDAQFTPRLAAIRLLREKIEAKRAGLDPWDTRDFIIELGPNDVKWGTISVCLCGWPTDRYERADGSVRLKAVLEADVRSELGLDGPDAPLMADEPLASRGLALAAELLMDATVEALERPRPGDLLPIPCASCGHRHVVGLTGGDGGCRTCSCHTKAEHEPVCLDAIREAKAAYDARYPHGVEPQLALRTDADGVA